jgi:nucleotide-binding universal stress UspA family protein
MYRHILIPTDGSELARKAVDAGTDYARETGAKVTLFTAVPEYQMPSEAELMARHRIKPVSEFEEESKVAAEAILAKAAASAKDANITFDMDFAMSDRPYEAIIAAAKKHGCDAIFMASHGRTGLAEMWHGSQTHEVLTRSSIPTLVYR